MKKTEKKRELVIEDIVSQVKEIDAILEQPVSALLNGMKADELMRLNDTLKLHLASKDGQNDLGVADLQTAVDYVLMDKE